MESAPPADSADALDVSVIVPTINEAENLTPLVTRIAAALAGVTYEVIIVDDNSRDRTPEVCAELAKTYPLKLMVRKEPKNGLSGAVLHGMESARGKYLCVMDADLQHPPESLPDLLRPLREGSADFVIGSRYMPGGSTQMEWGWFRKLNSRTATLLARPFAGKCTDPMAGFFALDRQTHQSAQNLTPLGYKIALELMCKCRVKAVKEIPIQFGNRLKGESKLSIKQQFRYLEHLSRLYDFTYPRASPMTKFLLAVGLAWFVAALVYAGLVFNGTDYSDAATTAYPVAIVITAILHFRYVRTQREFISRRRPWLDFAVISLAEWATCALVALWISERVAHPTAPETFILCFGAATITRYILRKEFLQDIRGLRRTVTP